MNKLMYVLACVGITVVSAYSPTSRVLAQTLPAEPLCLQDTTVCVDDLCSPGAMLPVACDSPPPTPIPTSSQSSNPEQENSIEEPVPPTPTPKPRVLAARRGPNDIPNHLVPITVERIFNQIFGRHITHPESLFWKKRARSDKPTENLLRRTMAWHKANVL